MAGQPQGCLCNRLGQRRHYTAVVCFAKADPSTVAQAGAGRQATWRRCSNAFVALFLYQLAGKSGPLQPCYRALWVLLDAPSSVEWLGVPRSNVEPKIHGRCVEKVVASERCFLMFYVNLSTTQKRQKSKRRPRSFDQEAIASRGCWRGIWTPATGGERVTKSRRVLRCYREAAPGFATSQGKERLGAARSSVEKTR
jgi:hypothetical protein